MRRIIPSVWSDNDLAKELLLHDGHAKTCINCSELLFVTDMIYCNKNELILDEYPIEKTTCRYFEMKDVL